MPADASPQEKDAQPRSRLDQRRRTKEKAREKGIEYRLYLRTSVKGLEVGLGPLIGFLIGHQIDKWLDIGPWGTIWCFIAGCISSGRVVYRLHQEGLKDEMDESDASNRDNPGGQK